MNETTQLEKKTTNSKELLTLREFIEHNQKLLSVLGIFTALTVFANNIPYEPFRSGLSFLFITLTILLWIETFFSRSSVEKKYTWRLRWFDDLLGFTILVLIAYWLVAFSPIWHDYLFILLYTLSNGVFGLILKRLNIYQRLNRPANSKRKSLRKFIWWTLIIVWLLLCAYICSILSPTIWQFLDQQHRQLQHNG
jgi:hypothetical protein